MKILNSTKIFCSISHPGADLTGVLYNEIISELGIEGIYLPLTSINPIHSYNGIRSFSFDGVTVSMPYKQDIIECLDSIDEIAEKIGAVNTVFRSGKKYIGSNTDYYGAIATLEEQVNLDKLSVLLVGAGGAANAIAYGLKIKGCDVVICNRTNEKAVELSRKYELRYCDFKNLQNIEGVDVVINATSLGFLGQGDASTLFSESNFSSCKVVLDVVFSPVQTELILKAKNLGINVAYGSRMLVHQALKQFELWGYTGAPDVDKLEKRLIEFVEMEK